MVEWLGSVLRFLCLSPCSSLSPVHPKNTSDLAALNLSPTGLDLATWHHVPLGAGMAGATDATNRDAGETDQGPCLQINACSPAFVCGCQFDAHMSHAKAGRQGRPLILTRCCAYGLWFGQGAVSQTVLPSRRRAFCHYCTRVCCHRLGRSLPA